jgi:arabinofuranosyltransferase
MASKTRIAVAILLLAAPLALAPGRIFPSAAPVPGPEGIAFMQGRLIQLLLLLAGGWLLLADLRRAGPGSPESSGTAESPRRHELMVWGGMAAAGALLVAAGFLLRYGIIDDTYISLRYARNLARGIGLVYNAGERVEGYTSFLWVTLLGGLSRMGAGLTGASVAAGIISGLCLVPLTWKLLPPRERISPTLLLFLSFSIPLVFWSFSGMETSLFTALLLLAVMALRKEGRLAGLRPGLLFGLAVLARPESWLYALIALPFVLLPEAPTPGRRTRRAGLMALGLFGLGFLALAGTHLLFRLAYYGDLLPNTFYVKVGGFSFGLLGHGARYLLRGAVWHLPLIAFALAGWIWRDPAETPEASRTRALAAAMVLGQAAAVLYTGADHFREMRYFVPMLPFLLVLAAPGFSACARRLAGRRVALIPRLREGCVLTGAVLSLLLSFHVGQVGYSSSILYGHAITMKWAEIGEWLGKTASPGDLLATPVAGALPYVSDLPTLDMLGLTDRTIAHKKTALGGAFKDHEKFDTDYMLTKRPRWIFLGHFQVKDLADYLRRPALPVGTELARRLPLPDYEMISGQYHGVGFTFLRRRD